MIFVTDLVNTGRAKPSDCFSSKLRQRENIKVSGEWGYTVWPVDCSVFWAVYAAGADSGKYGRKLPLSAAGYFRIPFVINTNQPEDLLFVSLIHKERNMQVCAALNSIIKAVKAQNLSFFFVKKIISMKFHGIAGGICFFETQVFFYGV
ncbi:hypothetical protein ACSHHH_005034 [Escherichia coli]|uniref:hypothetical protein n=1 Tax=Escherichia coli TaxID=562 RepID=UPI0002CC5936|nr:hypothetical protein [Escherichia coli]EMW46566.1 putative transposase [Escherichia coli 2762100]